VLETELNSVNRNWIFLFAMGKRKLVELTLATSHVNSDLSNVTIQFLPPNLTSEVQPLDKGIIQSVKLLYRKQLDRKSTRLNSSHCT
jgi:hypothetical protein